MDRTQLAIQSVVSFLYGLGFFVLGAATAFQSRVRSEFPLTRAIWALAGFGILHAIHEWILVFSPIQLFVLPETGLLYFKLAEVSFATLSWTLLLYFGICLLPDSDQGGAALRKAPLVIFSVWLALLVKAGLTFHKLPLPEAFAQLVALDRLSHLVLGLPGALVSALALLSQAARFGQTRLERLVNPLRFAACSFIAFSGLIALAIPKRLFFSLALGLGARPVWWMPLQVFQVLTVVGMTLATMRVLAIFNQEGERRLEEAETQRAILNERLRISRDLHDGVMQSVYAVGLALENVLFLMNEDRPRARKELERSMARLNDTIQDIRGYILNLRPARRTAGDLHASLLEVVAQFRASVELRTSIDLDALREVTLAPEKVDEVCQIVREALTNVARHAKATEVAVSAQVRWGEQVDISVWDNGQGFHPGDVHREGRQGLNNMCERAEGLGGSLSVNSRKGRGTEVVLHLPEGRGASGEPQHSNSTR